MRLTAFLLLLSFAVFLPGRGAGQEAQAVNAGAPPIVELEGNGPSIEAHATIRIHASRAAVWAILSSCPEALKIVPGLEACEVLERAPDASWARIRQVMAYSWLLPRVRIEVKASYQQPAAMSFERVGGDLVGLRGAWDLQKDGDYTMARYSLVLESGFWVPHWILRAVMKRDLPKMLQALRRKAESTAPENLG
ncbi:MAG: SRPBCC family protein [Steroidobacterales bacterium]